MGLVYDALMRERLKLRPNKEQSAISRVQFIFGDAYRPTIMAESSHDVVTVIDEKEKEQTSRRQMKASKEERKKHLTDTHSVSADFFITSDK